MQNYVNQQWLKIHWGNWLVKSTGLTHSPTVVVDMRLIRRPWKGCLLWDAPFTIPWQGCKFEKISLQKWGFRIWISALFNMLHMLFYGHQEGAGGMLTFLRSIIHGPWNFLPLLTCCTCSLMVIRWVLTAGHGVIMSPWFALLESVAMALPKDKSHKYQHFVS